MTKERAAKIILDMINGAESTFGHSLSTLEINALKKGYCALNPEPTTNADRIRAMSDEELVKYIEYLVKAKGVFCFEHCLNWLKEESNSYSFFWEEQGR